LSKVVEECKKEMKWIQSEIMCPIADVDQSLVSGHNEDEQFLENAKKIKVDNDFNSFLNALKRKFTNIANIPKKIQLLNHKPDSWG